MSEDKVYKDIQDGLDEDYWFIEMNVEKGKNCRRCERLCYFIRLDDYNFDSVYL